MACFLKFLAIFGRKKRRQGEKFRVGGGFRPEVAFEVQHFDFFGGEIDRFQLQSGRSEARRLQFYLLFSYYVGENTGSGTAHDFFLVEGFSEKENGVEDFGNFCLAAFYI